jgi:hypothetical protein
MKRILAIAVAILTLTTVSAQSEDGKEVNYYGLDFSKTKTFSAAEPGWEFKSTFESINALVLREWSKYNPGRYLRNRIVLRDISATQMVNDVIDPAEIAVNSSRYRLTDEDIAGMVRRYDLLEQEGTGLVILGELFDKSLATGSFVVVYFDIATREVLEYFDITGKARGFGLRNYWAGALYYALKY